MLILVTTGCWDHARGQDEEREEEGEGEEEEEEGEKEMIWLRVHHYFPSSQTHAC